MFVHGRFSMMPGNHVTEHVQHANRSAEKQIAAMQSNRAGLRPSKDTVSFSPQGKANSALSGLEKLRQQIEDRRCEFLSKAAEEGQSAEAIQAQLDSFDRQLKDIDKQIAQLTIQRTNQNIEQAKQHTSNLSIQRPKTRQEVENARLADITNMSAGLAQAEAVHAVKTQVDGDIGIKKSEIELEKSRNGDTTQLEAELSDLQDRSHQLTASINDRLNETLEDIKESNDKVTNAEIVDEEKTEHKDAQSSDAMNETEGKDKVSVDAEPEYSAKEGDTEGSFAED